MATSTVEMLRRKKLIRHNTSPSPPTAHQIQLIRLSWERVVQLRLPADEDAVSPSHAFGLAFYDALFEYDPKLKSLFTNIFQQARALTGMIGYLARAPSMVADDTDNGYQLAQQMQQLGARHRQYNVHPDSLKLVGPAFVKALQARLLDEYQPEIGDAWLAAHAYVAYHMAIGLKATQRAWDDRNNVCSIQ
ncbi:globin-like protein [Dichotomocladium elegans]|nr:globin-like protein [Dichotomocladium elegans]